MDSITTLKEVLLTSIEKTLDSQEFYNGLDNSHWKDWNEQQKFNWAWKLYNSTVGAYESEPFKSPEYWLSGLGLHVPFESYKIRSMGFNSDTWFKDLADELQKQVGIKLVKVETHKGVVYENFEGEFITGFHD